MSFDRWHIKETCDTICTSSYASNNHCFFTKPLDNDAVTQLGQSAKKDAVLWYMRGMQSLWEATASAKNKLFCWATVKAYYSVFYFLRSFLSTSNYVILRENRTPYLFKLEVGLTPEKLTKFRNDHEGTIYLMKRIFPTTDVLQSNTIEDTNPYEWLMQKRNRINYIGRDFADPVAPDFWQSIGQAVDDGTFEELIRMYFEDSALIYCFQPDHAVLSLPIRRALSSYAALQNKGLLFSMNSDKRSLLSSMLAAPNVLNDFAKISALDCGIGS